MTSPGHSVKPSNQYRHMSNNNFLWFEATKVGGDLLSTAVTDTKQYRILKGEEKYPLTLE